MTRPVLALVLLAGVAADSQACFFGRARERRAARQAAAVQTYQPAASAVASSCPTCPVQTSPATVPGNCPGGRCPLPRPVVEVPTAPAAEPTLVVFATPRRMP